MADAMAYVPNEVISTKLDALTGEVRELRRELVRRDVYEAERRADDMRLVALETQLAGSAANKRQVNYALIGAALSLVVSIMLRFVH